MRLEKAPAIYSVVVGILMIGWWIVSYVTDSIPELRTEPIEFRFHMTAEITTATMLIIAGFGMLTNRKWGFRVYLLSVGMLLYTLIQTPGYFAQRGELALVPMFAALLVLTVSFIVLSFRRTDKVETKGL